MAAPKFEAKIESKIEPKTEPKIEPKIEPNIDPKFEAENIHTSERFLAICDISGHRNVSNPTGRPASRIRIMS